MCFSDKLNVSILDEIYFICREHRDVFDDLDKMGICYINEGILGYRHIQPILCNLPLVITSDFEECDLFVKHKKIWAPMNPKVDEERWLRISTPGK